MCHRVLHIVTGLVDEADRERLIDALHNFVKKSLPKDKAGKYPVANPKVLKSWSRENLEKLDMIDLVECVISITLRI